jgi:hypothetical protein
MAARFDAAARDEGAAHFRVLSACVRGFAAWTDCAVIRICYENFATGTRDVSGLHGRTERAARGVTLYLLPGLTAGQRKAVIRRLRQEASRGFGPPLPLPQLAIAMSLDRVRTAARIAAAIIRLHPAVTLLPGAFMVAVMALFVVASATGGVSAPKLRVGLMQGAPAGGGANLRVMGTQSPQSQTARMAVELRPTPSRIVPVRVSLPAGGRR